jgi:hypothetical protein
MVDWSQSLIRVLALKSGGRLTTLLDAAKVIGRRFGSARFRACAAQYDELKQAIGVIEALW